MKYLVPGEMKGEFLLINSRNILGFLRRVEDDKARIFHFQTKVNPQNIMHAWGLKAERNRRITTII